LDIPKRATPYVPQTRVLLNLRGVARDQQGLKVDFLMPRTNSDLWLVEAKAGKTVRSSMAAALLSCMRAQTVPVVDRSGRVGAVPQSAFITIPS
jgi:hypothetical protein